MNTTSWGSLHREEHQFTASGGKAEGIFTMTSTTTLKEILEEARHRIEVSDPELDEARKRRSALTSALRAEFPGARTYVNGSIAHGDALTPLTDVDLGVVVPDTDNEYGPGKQGPKQLKDRAAKAIRTGLKDDYGDLAVEVEGRKRSILVRFRDPVAPGQPDFTADVIVAIDNADARGLYIPRFQSWDRAHPEHHTELVLSANQTSKSTFARVVRLIKHWNCRNSKPLCSWNIKALALDCITTPTALLPAIREWFRCAIEQLFVSETPDPARVAKNPIKLNEKMTRTEVVRRLSRALERLDRAIQLEKAGYPLLAHDELAKFFNDADMLPAPDPAAVRHEEARRVTDQKKKDTQVYGAPALLTGTGVAAGTERSNVRSWGI